jgi:hypothetical protein
VLGSSAGLPPKRLRDGHQSHEDANVPTLNTAEAEVDVMRASKGPIRNDLFTLAERLREACDW